MNTWRHGKGSGYPPHSHLFLLGVAFAAVLRQAMELLEWRLPQWFFRVDVHGCSFFLKQNKPTTNQSKIELTSKVGNHDMKLPVRQWVLLVETDMEDIRSPATRCDHCSASSCFDHEGGMWMNSGWLFDISDHSNDGYLSDLYVTYCWAPSSYMFFFFSKYRCFF